jgi:integrase
MQLSREWRRMRKALELGPEEKQYSSTRHTALNRWIDDGAPEQVASEALGHSDVRVTRKHYKLVVRTRFPAEMRRGLGLAVNGDAALSVSK